MLRKATGVHIKVDDFWVNYIHPDHPKSSNFKSVGKWTYHDTPERVESLANQLVTLIYSGLCPEIKFKPIPNDPKGPYAHLLPPLIVYTDGENKDQIFERMCRLGLEGIYWVSSQETNERVEAQQDAIIAAIVLRRLDAEASKSGKPSDF